MRSTLKYTGFSQFYQNLPALAGSGSVELQAREVFRGTLQLSDRSSLGEILIKIFRDADIVKDKRCLNLFTESGKEKGYFSVDIPKMRNSSAHALDHKSSRNFFSPEEYEYFLESVFIPLLDFFAAYRH